VIKTKSDFEKYVVCNKDLDIDFSLKMILAGKYLSNHCASVTSQSVERNCRGEIIYNVEILKDDCNAMTWVDYFVIVDRSNNRVKFNLSIKP
jgi:hypothetical protein